MDVAAHLMAHRLLLMIETGRFMVVAARNAHILERG
jgi:hypothetical protein